MKVKCVRPVLWLVLKSPQQLAGCSFTQPCKSSWQWEVPPVVTSWKIMVPKRPYDTAPSFQLILWSEPVNKSLKQEQNYSSGV